MNSIWDIDFCLALQSRNSAALAGVINVGGVWKNSYVFGLKVNSDLEIDFRLAPQS